MTKKFNYGWIPVLIFSLFCACATVQTGRKFDPELPRKIAVCKTTRTQMLDLFGEPYQKGLENGLDVWLWSYASANGFTQKLEQQYLWVTFDERSTVVDYAYNTRQDYKAHNNCKK